MDSAMLVRTAAVVLAVAALGGLLMAGMRFAGFAVGIPRPAWIGIVLLVLAALGGVFLNLAYHDKHLPLPKGIMIVHALVAVAGFGLVFLAAFVQA
jgi:hypothetical protein